MRMISLAFLWLAACTPEEAEDTGEEFDTDPPTVLGGEREAAVVLPSDYSIDQEWPLIVLLHGYSVDSTLQDYIFGLRDRVDSDGFILVLPEGTVDSYGNQFWNATPECCDFDHTDVDDVAYVGGLIEEAHTVYPVSRVALVGHSNGGFMSYRMACERPDLIDTIVALAGATFKDEALCIGTDPVSVATIHGTLDASVGYESSATHAGAEETVERWVAKAGCDETRVSLPSRNHLSGVVGDETTVARWSGCEGDVPVELWTGVGADHTYLQRTEQFQNDVTAFALGTPN